MTLVEVGLILGALLTAAITTLKVVASKTATESDDEALSVLQRIQKFVQVRKSK